MNSEPEYHEVSPQRSSVSTILIHEITRQSTPCGVDQDSYGEGLLETTGTEERVCWQKGKYYDYEI